MNELTLFDGHGGRKYLCATELPRFLKAASEADHEVRIFCCVLTLTGCRISEALGLTPPRSLHLTMVGGINAVPMLAAAFGALTFIDTSAFVNAIQRKRLYESNHGKIDKADVQTEKGAPLDELLRNNIQIMQSRVEKLVSEARSVPPARYTALTPRIPGRKPSVKAVPSLGSAEAPQSSGHGRQSGNADRR